MARGFLSGAFWGVLVAVAGAGALSILSDGPEAPLRKPEAAAVEVPPGSEFNQSRDDGAASLPASEPVVAGTQAPKVMAPEPDDLSPLKTADTDPGAQPSAGAQPGGLNEPAAGQGGAPMVSARDDGPVPQGAQSGAPQAPQDEAELSISTEPAQPMPPPAEPEETAFAEPEPEPEPEAEMVPEAAPEVLSDAPNMPMAPIVETAESQAQAPVENRADMAQPIEKADVPTKPAESAQELVIRVAPEPATPAATAQGSTDSAEAAEPETRLAEAPTDDTQPVIEPVIEPVPDVAQEPQPVGQTPAIRIGKPASDLESLRAKDIRTGRLPSVRAGGDVRSEAALPSDDMAPDRSAMPPIKRFAVEFEAAENKPKMAIVLMDDGGESMAMEALSAFPFPLAFAVDTGRENAADRMAIYRAAGFEVLAMVSLPDGAEPSDVEVSMPVLLNRVPEALAVMEAPEDGIQSDRAVSDQVARILADTGHGLLLYPKGLNTAQKLAAKNGVPSATIFRDIDSAGQKPRAIRRFLDNGALKAGSEGGVVMVGRVRPDTVNALLLWGLEDRADQIALVPVSQLLQPQN